MTATELRAIKPLPFGKNDTYIGYYDDPAIFEAHARRLSNDGYNIYSPINPIKPEVATELNQPPRRRHALRKEGVARRLVLPYDYDVDRPTGQAASDAELRAARTVVQKRVNFWRGRGVVPRVKHSGNGYQLELPIDLPNDAASEVLVKKVSRPIKPKMMLLGFISTVGETPIASFVCRDTRTGKAMVPRIALTGR